MLNSALVNRLGEIITANKRKRFFDEKEEKTVDQKSEGRERKGE